MSFFYKYSNTHVHSDEDMTKLVHAN